MIQYQECETCGRYDITGFMFCADHGHHQVCPVCTAAILGVDEGEIRALLMSEFCGLQAARLTSVSFAMFSTLEIPCNNDTGRAFAAGYMYRVTSERQALDNLDTAQEEGNGGD